MFVEIFKLYMQGLVFAICFVLIAGFLWLGFRASRQLDKTAKEKQAFLYDILMLAIMTIPILSFAFMALIVMIRA